MLPPVPASNDRFKRERLPSAPNEVMVKSVCKKCDHHFTTDITYLSAKEQEHILTCKKTKA